jgi:outer membrane receptor protein involved in Fe transport
VPTSLTRQATRLANCQETYREYGLPADVARQSNAVRSSVPGTSQGDRNLLNETANAWTAGFVLRPRWIEDFELAVDWIDIRVDDAITTLDANGIASACFDNPT